MDPEIEYEPTEEEEARDTTAVEAFLHEFFTAPHVPASNHEEWLLRMCAQMMQREAAARAAFSVSVQPGPAPHRRSRRRGEPWNKNAPTSSDDSAASIGPSTGTGGASWSES